MARVGITLSCARGRHQRRGARLFKEEFCCRGKDEAATESVGGGGGGGDGGGVRGGRRRLRLHGEIYVCHSAGPFLPVIKDLYLRSARARVPGMLPCSFDEEKESEREGERTRREGSIDDREKSMPLPCSVRVTFPDRRYAVVDWSHVHTVYARAKANTAE